MRRQYFDWIIGVIGIFGTVYGGYLLAYHFNHGNGLSVPAVVLLVLGILCLSFSFALVISRYFFQKKKKRQQQVVEEVIIEEKIEEPTKVEEEKEKSSPSPRQKEYTPREYRSTMSDYVSTVYVKQVGYGPVLRVEGSRILDMRTNAYYRIENNLLMQEGYGPVYEIRGNQIKSAFGGYLYEISGSNINKVFGGFYASISGHYITLFDLSMKYEFTDELSKKQLLAVAALLFGKY